LNTWCVSAAGEGHALKWALDNGSEHLDGDTLEEWRSMDTTRMSPRRRIRNSDGEEASPEFIYC